MYFNVNFNVFFKLIKVHLLMSELYIFQCLNSHKKVASQMIVVFTVYTFFAPT